MFGRIGRFAVDRPWITIGIWIVTAIVVTIFSPALKSTTDDIEFLPSDYESVQAQEIAEEAFPPEAAHAAVAVFQRSDGGELTDEDLSTVTEIARTLDQADHPKIARVEAGPGNVSPNGLVALATVVPAVDDPYHEDVLESVRTLREDTARLVDGTGLTAGYTGTSATAVDEIDTAGDTDALVMMGTLLLIIVLLLLTFRSALIAFLPVLMILLVYLVATGLIATAASVLGMPADTSAVAILIVVVFGVGTDYLLFVLFRYREHLRDGMAPKDALKKSVARVGSTVASAAGTEIAAFLALLVSTMGILRVMGPSLAISVAVTLVASLTLFPAVFSLLGTKAFWPSKAWRRHPDNRLARGIGSAVSRRPAMVALVSGATMVVLALGTFSFKAEYSAENSLPDDLESVQASEDLQKCFPAGQTDPAIVMVRATDGGRLDEAGLAAFQESVGGTAGVGKVLPPQLSEDGQTARIDVVLEHNPTTTDAVDIVSGELRGAVQEAAPAGTEAFVGGTTAVLADIQKAIERDYMVVFPIAGLVILLILALTLRSLIAPALLMLAVGLGFLATLGATVWLFQGLRGADGLLFTLPVFVYLFVVAMGTDYNILVVNRLREELDNGAEPREAVRVSVTHSVPTIVAAAIILAGSFGVLMLARNALLQQLGFAVSFGIMLSAFLMAMLLVPALFALLGRPAWWPAKLRPKTGDEPGAAGDAAEPAGAAVPAPVP